MSTDKPSAAAITETRMASNGQSGLSALITRPEFFTFILLIVAFVVGAILSPYFLDIPYLLDNTSTYIEIGIMGLGLVFVIISGNIDLSVEATLALVACAAGVMYFDLSIPMPIVIIISLALGAALGWMNGVLVTRMKLPALVVTLATLALYRGLANIIVGDDSRPKLAWSRDIVFPKWFLGIDRVYIPGTPLALDLVILIVLAVLLSIVLTRTTLGRWVYAIGTNEQAARYSGIPVERVKLLIFTLSGFLAGLAGLVMVSRLSVARYDHARGWVLDTITAVVLGGVSIDGGRGTILGAVLAFLVIVILRTGMGVANVKAESQLTVIGALLIVAILASNFIGRFRKQS